MIDKRKLREKIDYQMSLEINNLFCVLIYRLFHILFVIRLLLKKINNIYIFQPFQCKKTHFRIMDLNMKRNSLEGKGKGNRRAIGAQNKLPFLQKNYKSWNNKITFIFG